MYLSGKGAKPKRYARILGDGDCVTREYMIGPLPVNMRQEQCPSTTCTVETQRW